EVLSEDEFRDWPDVGIAIQAYLTDTPADLDRLRQWAEKRGTPVVVRLVKGAYWDYETILCRQNGWRPPVWLHKWETDACYEEMTRFLLQNYRHLRPAYGSHNVRSIAHALAAAEELGVPPRTIEFQTLYGMADPTKEALVSLGQRVRVYTPYGQLLPGMAYLVRRLLEKKANDSFLRASFIEHVSEVKLLMNTLHRSGTETPKSRFVETPGAYGEPALRPFRNEPVTDFSREDAREAMQTALAAVAAQLGKTYPLVIDNEQVPTAATINWVNPSHYRQLVGSCGRATPAHAEQAVAAAREAFVGWRDREPARRAEYLFRAADVMRRRRFELAAWEVYECAKQWREADADVAEAIDFCDFYAHEMLRLAVPRRRDV